MQKTTGTLSPGAHPGSYNGQDAYNDMLVSYGKGNRNESQRYAPENQYGQGISIGGYGLQRPADNYEGGGMK